MIYGLVLCLVSVILADSVIELTPRPAISGFESPTERQVAMVDIAKQAANGVGTA